MTLPDSSVSVTLAPKTAADADRLARGLREMVASERQLYVMGDPQTGQTLVCAASIPDLERVIDRLKREFHVEAWVGRPSFTPGAGPPGA